MDDIMGIIIDIIPMVIYYGIPIVAIIVSICKLSQYQDAKLKRIMKPESYTDEDLKDMKKGVITAFVVAFVLAVIIFGIAALFASALMYM